MHKIGKITLYIGIVLIACGIIIGFGAMIKNADSQAINWLGMVPVGFILMLAGTVATQLSRSKDDENR
ncbi:MAG: hypothetical protein PVJ63_02160 [Thioalkalispiraceae bacterium]|jgi:uncharacterized membrane protein